MYLEMPDFKLAYNWYSLETISYATETGGEVKAGTREERSPGRPVEARTDSSVYMAFQSKSQQLQKCGIDQCVAVAIFHQLSWICEIATPEK